MSQRKNRKKIEHIKRKLAKEKPTMVFNFGGALAAYGPVIETKIGVTEEHARILQLAGHPVPPPIRCRLLIDTGADISLVKHDIAARAELKLISANTPIHGIGVDSTGRSYMGGIWFRCASRKFSHAEHTIWADAEISSGELPFDHIDGLIGRDVLAHFEMRYIGPKGRLTLTYIRRQRPSARAVKGYPAGSSPREASGSQEE